jgi:hypothetical protein
MAQTLCAAVCLVLQVLGRMKQALVEQPATQSFLLEDDSTLPFIATEILSRLDDQVSMC